MRIRISPIVSQDDLNEAICQPESYDVKHKGRSVTRYDGLCRHSN